MQCVRKCVVSPATYSMAAVASAKAAPTRRRAPSETLETTARMQHAKVCGRHSLLPYKQKPANRSSRAFHLNNAGSDLLSHTLSHAVPSAVSGLTSVFGMGTGVTLIL